MSKDLEIKLIKKDMEARIEAYKLKQGGITDDQMYAIIYNACRELLPLDTKMKLEMFFNEIEKLEDEYAKNQKNFSIKHKSMVDEMHGDIKKL